MFGNTLYDITHRMPLLKPDAGGGEAGAETEGGEKGGASAPTFDEALKNPAYQAEFDRRVTKALQTAQDKWQKDAEARIQAADKLEKTTGLKASVEKADQHAFKSWYRVTVGSVQTLMRDSRLNAFPEDYFHTIVVDEAHHILSDGYKRVMDHFPDAKVLGVTATPDRGDMKNLGEFFESLAYEYPLNRAVKEGYLCKIRAQTVPLKIDISGVKTQNGDYALADVGTALDPYLSAIAQEMKTYCAGRKTFVFLPLIKTSQKMCALLKEQGFNAAEVNGESADRAQILSDFDQGRYDVLCNSMLLTEGWDCPSVDCIVVLRPTKIRSLYCQMVGRHKKGVGRNEKKGRRRRQQR